jgi:DNA-binding CsgD family transcriptional regulator
VGDWLGAHGSTPDQLRARLAAERAGAPFVELRDGAGEQRLVPLGPGPLTIGRAPACGLPLEWDGQVSRGHASLEPLDEGWTVVDDGRSTNGTFVNEERVHGRRRLGHLDVIRVGRTLLRFHDRGAADLARTEAALEPPVRTLTEAQRRVLVALCGPGGVPASNDEVARALHLSVDTVKTHMRALFDAFGLASAPPYRKRFELVRRAVETGLAMPPSPR